jgi:hypothetical protein
MLFLSLNLLSLDQIKKTGTVIENRLEPTWATGAVTMLFLTSLIPNLHATAADTEFSYQLNSTGVWLISAKFRTTDAKFSDEVIDEDDEIITLSKNDHEINIAGLIYEYINVAMPFISVCSDEGNTSIVIKRCSKS